MINNSIGLLAILVIVTGITPAAFALTELERTSIGNPRLENTSGAPLVDKINVNQQIQISADIINHQTKSQEFIYIVQIKNSANVVVSLEWIGGQLTPNQKFSSSISWAATSSGEYTAEIFVWENFKNYSALTEYSKKLISVV